MSKTRSPIQRLIALAAEQRVITLVVLIILLGWGILVAPFNWDISGIPRDPVPVDAIPDIGENQQIVFTEWPGRSPQDVEDQITYPLTVALLGTPEVKTVRSFSMFGFSSIYVIFHEEVDFYWSRSRLLEKLNALPPGTLPEGITPRLGPDATGLGQVFWYTLEGRDDSGSITGGWDLAELRSVQDYYVRYGLSTVPGVAEVASVGGHVKEYQIDVDPQALRHYGISLLDVYSALRASNNEVGARTLEVNRVEYLVRALGFLKSIEDIESTVLRAGQQGSITIADVAHVSLGPAMRRGALDKQGAEAVGGVVTTRYGVNPMETLEAVKAKIAEISPGLPSKVLDDGRRSQLTIVPFYDRSDLISETLGTLNHALRDEILITVIVIMVLLVHLRASILISAIMPMAVLLTFVGMKLFNVDANVVALSGIAIAIGTIVDMGIVMTENILKHIDGKSKGDSRSAAIVKAAQEVGPAILTAVSTTIISFLPVFFMEGPEGKLFKPLAYTKTFALFGSVLLAVLVLPVLAGFLLRRFDLKAWMISAWDILLVIVGLWVSVQFSILAGISMILLVVHKLLKGQAWLPAWLADDSWSNRLLILAGVGVLARYWVPVGNEHSALLNLAFILVIISVVLSLVRLFISNYSRMLSWMLNHKRIALSLPVILILLGSLSWLGIDRLTFWLPDALKSNRPFQTVAQLFPGLGKEFMPPLDEGSFLYMPTTMPHAGMEEALDVVSILDQAIYSVPEVEEVVGKIGRAETPLDPAPLSMIESIITYKSEYRQDVAGNVLRFQVDQGGHYSRDEEGRLIPDPRGKPFRQWRDHIRSNQDIWDEIVAVAQIPGTTSAPKLQPIAARIVMLQSGMRAPMGIRVQGSSIEVMEQFGMQLEMILKEIPGINSASVYADRIVGKPYIEIDIDREALVNYGLTIGEVQSIIEVALGGKQVTTAFEGRERYPVRVRYMRDYRERAEDFESILIPLRNGAQIPLGQIARIQYARGPQVIKSENTFLLSYVLFDRLPGLAEVDAVERVRGELLARIDKGELTVPPGLTYDFTGSYENQVRASQRLRLILPLALMLIFLVLYLQFGRASTTMIVFSGVFVAWAGGFVLLWFYGQPWFMDIGLGGISLREIFQIGPTNLSIAVWVGFLALFGIATDDGVLISTYLDQKFNSLKPRTMKEIHKAAILAGEKRIRPAMITTATTVLALLPVITSSGRGSDIMIPMAIPSLGGMLFVTLNTLIVPVIYTWFAERRILNDIDEVVKP